MNVTNRSAGTKAENERRTKNSKMKNGKPEEITRKENTRHAKMPVSQRAKQFMPFAAVTGLDAALHAKEQEMEQLRKEFEGNEDFSDRI